MTELQKTLDKQGLEIVENQKDNMVGRKKLAEQTRGAFRLASRRRPSNAPTRRAGSLRLVGAEADARLFLGGRLQEGD